MHEMLQEAIRKSLLTPHEPEKPKVAVMPAHILKPIISSHPIVPSGPVEGPLRPSLFDISTSVAEFFGEELRILRTPTIRAKAYPRQIAYYLSRMLTDRSYAQIAKFFRRDHTTVIYGVNEIRRRLAKGNEVLAREIEILTARFKPNGEQNGP